MSRCKALLLLLIPSCIAVLFLPVFIFTYLYPAIDTLLISDTEHQARMVADHLSTYINAAEGGLRPRDITFDLRGEIAEMAEHFSLEKVKIYFRNRGRSSIPPPRRISVPGTTKSIFIPSCCGGGISPGWSRRMP